MWKNAWFNFHELRMSYFRFFRTIYVVVCVCVCVCSQQIGLSRILFHFKFFFSIGKLKYLLSIFDFNHFPQHWYWPWLISMIWRTGDYSDVYSRAARSWVDSTRLGSRKPSSRRSTWDFALIPRWFDSNQNQTSSNYT